MTLKLKPASVTSPNSLTSQSKLFHNPTLRMRLEPDSECPAERKDFGIYLLEVRQSPVIRTGEGQGAEQDGPLDAV